MDRKELNAINQLFERLDKCLVWNAALLGRRNPTPEMETVNELGDLFERHRYLKNDHDFAPGEAEALLGFSDPLVVAQSCWKENSFTNSFPICKILNDIRAYDRFMLTTAEQERRKGPQIQQLKERLEQNLTAYMDSFTHEIMRDLNSPEYLAEMVAAYPGFTAKDEKSSLLDRLHKTEKAAGQRPPQEDKPHRKSDAPNL